LIPVFVRRANTRFAPTLVSDIGWISIYPKNYDRLLKTSQKTKNNMKHKNNSLPLNGLIKLLESNGFKIAPDHYIQAQKLLRNIHKDIPPQKLKFLLCPLFATRPKEQTLFYQLFDQYFQWQPKPESLPDEEPPETTMKAQKKVRRLNISYFILAFLLIFMVLGIAAYLGIHEDIPPPPKEKIITNTVHVPHQDKPLETITIKLYPDNLNMPKMTWYQKYGHFLRWSCICLPILFFLIGLVYRWHRRQIILEKKQGKPPALWQQFIFKRPDITAIKTATFYAAARRLRRRLKSSIRKLHIEKTIQASIKATGFPVLRHIHLSRPPEYLVLIHVPDPHDHYASFCDTLIHAFKEEDIHMTCYYYRQVPRVCYQQVDGPYFTPDDLWSRHASARLLIFGTGEHFLDPFSGKSEQWLAPYFQWKDRAIFTPKPTGEWGMLEVGLARHMTVLPVHLTAIDAVVRYFEYPHRYNLAQWFQQHESLLSETQYENIEFLRNWLGKRAFKWLCACAVYPELHFNLTVRIGHKISEDVHFSGDDLLKLMILQWFKKGHIPDDLRYQLMQSMSNDEIQEIREVILAVLMDHEIQKDAPGFDLYSLNLAINRFLCNPEERRLKRQFKESLANMPESEYLRDYTMIRLLDSTQKTPLQFLLPQKMMKRFYRHNLPVLCLKTRMRFIRAIILAGLAFFLITPPPPVEVPVVQPVVSFDFVKIPAGKFMMGSPEDEEGRFKDEKQHEVELTKDYYMQTTELTQGQWIAVMGENPSNFKSCGLDCPVENVSWGDVQDYIKRLNAMSKTGGYRLPTEAEWEYAARAGTTTRYFWGDEADCSRTNYGNGVWSSECKNINPGKTLKVASFPSNVWGLYDMLGNVLEWCQDYYEENSYLNLSYQNPVNTNDSGRRVARGGSWYYEARLCRSAFRYGYEPVMRYDNLGARLVFLRGQ